MELYGNGGEIMPKPPIKAIESIKNYCEKTQCRRCVYGDENHIDGEINYVGCMLQENNPCDWELPWKEDPDDASS